MSNESEDLGDWEALTTGPVQFCDSDDEIFFGQPSDKELRRANRLRSRRTIIFEPGFRTRQSIMDFRSLTLNDCSIEPEFCDENLKFATTSSRDRANNYNLDNVSITSDDIVRSPIPRNCQDSSSVEFLSTDSSVSSEEFGEVQSDLGNTKEKAFQNEEEKSDLANKGKEIPASNDFDTNPSDMDKNKMLYSKVGTAEKDSDSDDEVSSASSEEFLKKDSVSTTHQKFEYSFESSDEISAVNESTEDIVEIDGYTSDNDSWSTSEELTNPRTDENLDWETSSDVEEEEIEKEEFARSLNDSVQDLELSEDEEEEEANGIDPVDSLEGYGEGEVEVEKEQDNVEAPEVMEELEEVQLKEDEVDVDNRKDDHEDNVEESEVEEDTEEELELDLEDEDKDDEDEESIDDADLDHNDEHNHEDEGENYWEDCDESNDDDANLDVDCNISDNTEHRDFDAKHSDIDCVDGYVFKDNVDCNMEILAELCMNKKQSLDLSSSFGRYIENKLNLLETSYTSQDSVRMIDTTKELTDSDLSDHLCNEAFKCVDTDVLSNVTVRQSTGTEEGEGRILDSGTVGEKPRVNGYRNGNEEPESIANEWELNEHKEVSESLSEELNTHNPHHGQDTNIFKSSNDSDEQFSPVKKQNHKKTRNLNESVQLLSNNIMDLSIDSAVHSMNSVDMFSLRTEQESGLLLETESESRQNVEKDFAGHFTPILAPKLKKLAAPRFPSLGVSLTVMEEAEDTEVLDENVSSPEKDMISLSVSRMDSLLQEYGSPAAIIEEIDRRCGETSKKHYPNIATTTYFKPLLPVIKENQDSNGISSSNSNHGDDINSGENVCGGVVGNHGNYGNVWNGTLDQTFDMPSLSVSRLESLMEIHGSPAAILERIERKTGSSCRNTLDDDLEELKQLQEEKEKLQREANQQFSDEEDSTTETATDYPGNSTEPPAAEFGTTSTTTCLPRLGKMNFTSSSHFAFDPSVLKEVNLNLYPGLSETLADRDQSGPQNAGLLAKLTKENTKVNGLPKVPLKFQSPGKPLIVTHEVSSIPTPKNSRIKWIDPIAENGDMSSPHLDKEPVKSILIKPTPDVLTVSSPTMTGLSPVHIHRPRKTKTLGRESLEQRYAKRLKQYQRELNQQKKKQNNDST